FLTTKIEVTVITTNGESVKDMTSKFDKLEKFEGQDFHRWQKKMHFLLTTLKVVYVMSTPSPVWSENKTLEATRKRMKWENDDYICRGHILNGMSDSLFDIYPNVESAKALWESLESKYMAGDASAEKFLVSNFMNHKMVDTRPIMEQFHEMLRILGQYTQHNLMMDEAISVAVIIDNLPSSWKEFKHEGYSDASWINNMKDHSSTSGWVFLLEGGVISWASKKQTCITSSTIESEFVALVAAGNEAEWLRIWFYGNSLWPKNRCLPFLSDTCGYALPS
ncbi:zinc finger, CCHC-type containing protein, partial [Tanacetum coccineum]